MNYPPNWLRNTPRAQTCLRGVVAAIALVIATGSDTFAQSAAILDECNQFAEGVNRNQTIMDAFEAEIATFATNAAAAETLEEITAAASQYVEAVDEVTDNLDVLATDLTALAFEDTQLANYRDDYVGVVTGFNTALDTVSTAMAAVAAAETQDDLSDSLAVVANDTSTAVEQIETLAVDESDLIDGVNTYCGVE